MVFFPLTFNFCLNFIFLINIFYFILFYFIFGTFSHKIGVLTIFTVLTMMIKAFLSVFPKMKLFFPLQFFRKAA